jgi:DNA-binding response OmpR family regulator
MMKKNILIAEDDEDIIELISLYLSSEGYDIYPAGNGLQALEIVKTQRIDLAVVDIMMPEMNGYDFIKKVRETNKFPIIVLSAKDMDSDRILGLNIGADVYITKPFNPLEVTAYVKALLRRYCELGCEIGTDDSSKGVTTLTIGELQLDLTKLLLRKNGQIIPLTATELKIVIKLMQSPGRVYTKAQLYTCIGGEAYESDDNTMMVHISNIRAKIEDDLSNPRYIKTVRGLGYKIEAL